MTDKEEVHPTIQKDGEGENLRHALALWRCNCTDNAIHLEKSYHQSFCLYVQYIERKEIAK